MKRVYGEVYGEDAFKGISVPFEMKYVLEFLVEQDENTIMGIYDTYEEYKDEEVEMSHYAKDGSNGTDDIDNVDDFKKWFFNSFRNVSQKTNDFIKNLPEIKINDYLSDQEARNLLDKIINDLEEIEMNMSFHKTSNTLINLIKFRDKWFNQVL